MSINLTNDTYSMFNQHLQPTSQQPRTNSYPVASSLRTLDSKRKGLRVSFAFFQAKYLPDGRVNEAVATVKEVSDLWKPGAMDGIPPFVMNFELYLSVAICFICLISIVCWCSICSFLKI